MKGKILIYISICLFFIGASTIFAFYFSGFAYPLNDYEKIDSDNKSRSYDWYVVQGLGESKYAPGHLGEDWSLKKTSYVIDSDIQEKFVYPAADGIIYGIGRWPECSYCREKTNNEKKKGCQSKCTMDDGSEGCFESNHGWGSVIIIKHEIPAEVEKTFISKGSILQGDSSKKIDASPAIENPKIVYTFYGHLKDVPQDRKEGEQVYAGMTELGKIGSICKKYSTTERYKPLHLHFEVKDQNAIDDTSEEIGDIKGVGGGYSHKDGYAANRYIPSKFIENNKIAFGEKPAEKQKAVAENKPIQKSILQQIQEWPQNVANGITGFVERKKQEAVLWMAQKSEEASLKTQKAVENWAQEQAEGFERGLRRGCMMETAYGTENNSQLSLFRNFRDKVLMKNEMGRNFVNAYYHQISPPVAQYFSSHFFAREAARLNFDSIAKVLEVSQPIWNI